MEFFSKNMTNFDLKNSIFDIKTEIALPINSQLINYVISIDLE